MSPKKINAIIIALLLCGLIVLLLSFSKWNHNQNKTVDPSYGGIFTYAVEDRIEKLNPRTVVWFTSKNALSLIYDSLISVSKDLSLVPRICESWKMSAENKVFSCKIKKGVYFHDGKELTADDVVFSLNYILKGGGLDIGDFKLIDGIEDYWTGKTKEIRGVRKVDNYNLDIYLKKEFVNFVSMLASPRIVVLPKQLNGVSEEVFFEQPVGTGPFILRDHSDSELVVDANENYFLGRPYLDRIIFKTLDMANALEGFKVGSINDISSYSKKISMDSDIPHAKRLLINSYSTTSLFVNNSQPPFDDIRYRKALFSLVDRERIAKECFSNATVASSFIPQGILGHDANGQNVNEIFNINVARKILSSLPTYSIIVYHGGGGFNRCAEEIMNQIFRDVGVDWKIQSVDGHLLAKMFFSGKLLAHIETDEVKNDEAYTLLKYFESSNSENLSRINNETIDRLLDDVVLTNELSKKSELYKQINRLILQNHYALPILYPDSYSIIDGRYHGNEYRILTQYVDFTKIWKEKS